MSARRFMLLGTLLVGAGLCLAQTPATQPEVREGTRTQTAHGGGVWRSWFNASGAQVVAADPRAIWLGKGGQVWRYNVLQRRVDVFTSLLGQPELSDVFFRGCLAPDGKFAVSCRAAILLWDGNDWLRLPQPAGYANSRYLAFDANGGLWAAQLSQVFQWEGERWGLSVQVPRNSGIWAIGGNWLLWENTPQGKTWKRTLWNAAFTEQRDYDANAEGYAGTYALYRTGKGTVGVFWPWEQGTPRWSFAR